MATAVPVALAVLLLVSLVVYLWCWHRGRTHDATQDELLFAYFVCTDCSDVEQVADGVVPISCHGCGATPRYLVEFVDRDAAMAFAAERRYEVAMARRERQGYGRYRGFPVVLALCLALGALGGSTAQAAELGVQADGDLLDGNRPRVLNGAHDVGAGWVRVMVRMDRWPHDAVRYRDALTDARARGLRVMATLMIWRGIDGSRVAAPTAPQWGAFARSAVAELGDLVDAWGTSNEPNHPAFAPAQGTRCRMVPESSRSSQTSRIVDGYRVVTTYRRVKAGRGTHRRVVRYVKARRGAYERIRRNGHVRYVRERRGRYDRRVSFRRGRPRNYRQIFRREPLSRDSTIWVSTEWEASVCRQQELGAAYRATHDAAAAAIRSGDPSARLLFGDLAPNVTNRAFLDAFFEADRAPVIADDLGVHPYWHGDPADVVADTSTNLPNVEHVAQWVREWSAQGRLRAATRLSPGIVASEFGHQPGSPTAWTPQALSRLAAAGSDLVVYYELTSSGDPARWDTGLLEPDGSRRPRFDAVRDWAASA